MNDNTHKISPFITAKQVLDVQVPEELYDAIYQFTRNSNEDPKEYVLRAIVTKIEMDIQAYQSGIGFAKSALKQYADRRKNEQ